MIPLRRTAHTFSSLATSDFKRVLAQTSILENRVTFETHGVIAFSRPTGVAVDSSIEGWRKAALSVLGKYQALAMASPGGFGLKKERGFRQIVEKDAGRFDLNLDHVDDSDAHAEPDTAFITAVRRHAEAAARPFLTEIFGPDFVLNGKGLVISCPGAASQGWHVDSSHLFGRRQIRGGFPDYGTEAAQKEETGGTIAATPLPCHFVSVFVPLYAARAELGPTQVLLGSAPYTHVLPSGTVEDQYPPAAAVERIRRQARGGEASVECAPGDVVVMDGRTLHRGLANHSGEARPLCYFSFCPPWYREWPRSQNEGRSLFP